MSSEKPKKRPLSEMTGREEDIKKEKKEKDKIRMKFYKDLQSTRLNRKTRRNNRNNRNNRTRKTWYGTVLRNMPGSPRRPIDGGRKFRGGGRFDMTLGSQDTHGGNMTGANQAQIQAGEQAVSNNRNQLGGFMSELNPPPAMEAGNATSLVGAANTTQQGEADAVGDNPPEPSKCLREGAGAGGGKRRRGYRGKSPKKKRTKRIRGSRGNSPKRRGSRGNSPKRRGSRGNSPKRRRRKTKSILKKNKRKGGKKTRRGRKKRRVTFRFSKNPPRKL